MSVRFPTVTYKEIARVAKKLGFVLYRSARGSHEVWRRDSDGRQTTIPNHGSRNLKRRTMKAILDDLGINTAEFSRLKRG